MHKLFRTLTIFASLYLAAVTAVAEPTDLPEITDFRIEATESATKKIPILVLFKSDYCPYCVEALQNFLMPMQRDPAFKGKVILREIIVGSPQKFIDFNGNKTSTNDFAAKMQIWGVPHVILFDHNGNKLNEVKGLVIADFYYAYLTDAITEATAKIHNQKDKIQDKPAK